MPPPGRGRSAATADPHGSVQCGQAQPQDDIGPPFEPLSEDDLPGVLEMRTLSPVSDLQGIGRLTSLSVLHLRFDSLVDLSPLAALPVLKELYLRGGRLDDLGPLAGLSTLEILLIRGGEVTDLSALSGMSLRRLAILDNPRLDLTLGEVEVLWLTLMRCGIEDVSPLAGCHRSRSSSSTATGSLMCRRCWSCPCGASL